MEVVFTSRMNLSDLDLYECGIRICDPGHTYGPAVRSTYFIHYVWEGRGVFTDPKGSYVINGGSGFLIRPGVVVTYAADAEDPWRYVWIAFHGVKADTILARAGLDAENPAFAIADLGEVLAIHTDMMKATGFRYGRDLYLTGQLMRLLALQVEANSIRNPFKGDSDRRGQYIDTAVNFIRSNYDKDIGLKEISYHVGLDEKYLSHLFKEGLGTSPYRFLLEARMGKACELMADDQLSIGDISRSVGYDDPLLFSRMFKRFKGVSPKEYRKARLELEEDPHARILEKVEME